MAALLNISSETGSVVSPSDVYFDLWFLLIGALTIWTGYCAVDVDGIEGVACSLGTNTGGKISSLDIAWHEVVVGAVLDLVLEEEVQITWVTMSPMME